MKRHDKPADYDRYTGYMDARVLIEGLRAAGPGVTRASLVTAMEGLGNLDLGGFGYQFSPQNHHGPTMWTLRWWALAGCTGSESHDSLAASARAGLQGKAHRVAVPQQPPQRHAKASPRLPGAAGCVSPGALCRQNNKNPHLGTISAKFLRIVRICI
jgi:hypothetical protein